MTAQSPLPRACGGCGFGEGTFAGASRNDEDAPTPAIRGTALEPGSATEMNRAISDA